MQGYHSEVNMVGVTTLDYLEGAGVGGLRVGDGTWSVGHS